jgi:predicted DNA-binding transcriptional regulator AlpA
MGRSIDVDDLIDTQTVAELLELAHRNTVSEYQARYADMPRPIVDLGKGRSKLWLRSEVEPWVVMRRERADGRGLARRRSAGRP